MLELFFQTLEQGFGPSLSRFAGTVYWGSVLVLGISCLIPLYRLWRDYYAERVGLIRRWVMTCPQCQQATFVTGSQCGYCEAELQIPWTLKGLVPLWAERHGKLGRHLRRASRLVGLVGFLIATVVVMVAIGLFDTDGSLHRLFMGLCVLAWTALGRFATRTLRLEGGMSGRVSEAVMAAAALVVFAGTAFLADAARVQDDDRLMRLTMNGQAVRTGEGQTIATPTGEVRFEYLQLDHKVLGYQRIIPLAFHGDVRVRLTENDVEHWFVQQLLPYADGRSRHGLLIRLRTEHLRVMPGESYDLIQRDGQVFLRPFRST